MSWPAGWWCSATLIAFAGRFFNKGLEARDGAKRRLEFRPELNEPDNRKGEVHRVDETKTSASLAGGPAQVQGHAADDDSHARSRHGENNV